MKEEERRRVCDALNKIEEKLVSELLDAYSAGSPDFWDILDGLEVFLRVRRSLCQE